MTTATKGLTPAQVRDRVREQQAADGAAPTDGMPGPAGFPVYTVLDDKGQAHQVELVEWSVETATTRIMPVIERYARADLLDLALSGALFDDVQKDADPVTTALNRVADAIVTGGDFALIVTMLEECRRDGAILDKVGISLAYKANFGELRRTLAVALRHNYSDFFATRAAEMATFGARAIQAALAKLRPILKPESLATVLRGLPGSLSHGNSQPGTK